MADVFPPDILEHTGFAVDAEKVKRKSEISKWFDYFERDFLANFGQELIFNCYAIDQNNSDYWELLEDEIRPKIIKADARNVASSGSIKILVDRHKIASLTELLIMHHCPTVSTNDEYGRTINARLAFYVAQNIIGNWKHGYKNLKVSDSFNREPLTWLKLCADCGAAPVFSNAATWYLVELVFLERLNTGELTELTNN